MEEIGRRSAAAGPRAVANIPSAAGRDELDGVGRTNEWARREEAKFGKPRPVGQARAPPRNEAKFGNPPAMTSFAQWQANRRNAAKSTGPVTPEGKEHSRCNAVRHGLTAETVIGALEDAEDYRAFEAAIIADYDAQSAVERELVLRLASALWRLRRATAMETGLFEIEADRLSEYQSHRLQPASRELVYELFRPADPGSHGDDAASTPITSIKNCYPSSSRRLQNLPPILASTRPNAFWAWPICPTTRSIGLADMNTLWRQVSRVLTALDTLDRRKPGKRCGHFLVGGRSKQQAYGHDEG